MCKVWYELLISDEFIEYFSDENNRFYSVKDNKVVLEPMFQKYKDIIYGITYAPLVAEAFQKRGYDASENMKEYAPNVYLGLKSAIDYFRSNNTTIIELLNKPKGSATAELYNADPEKLTADQIAVLIMYPFWSRMGGSWEEVFLDRGYLKKYILILKDKYLKTQTA